MKTEAADQLAAFTVRQLFPHAAATLMIAVVGAGLVIRYREHLTRLLSTRARRIFWEGFVLAGLNACIALTAAAVDWRATFAGAIVPIESPLLWALAVFVGLLLSAQALAVAHADLSEDWRRRNNEIYRRDRTALQTELAHTRHQRNFFALINEAFLRVVSRKREHLRRAAADPALRANEPATQCQALIVACHEIIEKLVNEGRASEKRFRVRVAYFRIVGRRLVPMYCWDGTSGDCITSLIQNDPKVAARFDLDSGKTCLALAASKSGTTYAVPKAAEAANDPSHPFVYFDIVSEADELRSIVALPIKLSSDGQPFDVITVDTDLEGYFHKGDGQDVQLGVVLKNLAHRLQLEKALEERG